MISDWTLFLYTYRKIKLDVHIEQVILKFSNHKYFLIILKLQGQTFTYLLFISVAKYQAGVLEIANKLTE